MKVDNKTIKVDQELTTEIDFNDRAINDLYIKKGSRKDFTFLNLEYIDIKPISKKKKWFSLFSNNK